MSTISSSFQKECPCLPVKISFPPGIFNQILDLSTCFSFYCIFSLVKMANNFAFKLFKTLVSQF